MNDDCMFWPSSGAPISRASMVGTWIDWVFRFWHGWSCDRINKEVPWL